LVDAYCIDPELETLLNPLAAPEKEQCIKEVGRDGEWLAIQGDGA
jgi:hypothetical protein